MLIVSLEGTKNKEDAKADEKPEVEEMPLAEQSSVVHDDGIFTVTIGPSMSNPTATSSEGTSTTINTNVRVIFLFRKSVSVTYRY